MLFRSNKPVIALLGAGSMGTAIVRRMAAGAKIVLGDISTDTLERVAKEFTFSGYDVETVVVDACDKDSIYAFAQKAASFGEVQYYIHTAGASPNQAAPAHIIALDLIGTAYAIDAFAEVIAPNGAGLVISSQTGYMMHLSQELEQQLANTSTDELKKLDFIKKDAIANSGIEIGRAHV